MGRDLLSRLIDGARLSPTVGLAATALNVALWSGLCLTIVVYCLNMFGDAVRDLLDPRLRGGVGRLGV